MSLRRGELLNGAELILFPLESHFLSAIQRRCVKLQDATRGFMVARRGERHLKWAELSEVVFSSKQRVSSSFQQKRSDCAAISPIFFNEALVEERVVFLKVHCNFEKKFIENMAPLWVA